MTNGSEEWTTLNPNLASDEANEDGLSIKKMIAAGCGISLNLLAEPGNYNLVESEGTEGAFCHGFEHRQQQLICMVECLLKHVLARGALSNPRLKTECKITVVGDEVEILPTGFPASTERSESNE